MIVWDGIPGLSLGQFLETHVVIAWFSAVNWVENHRAVSSGAAVPALAAIAFLVRRMAVKSDQS